MSITRFKHLDTEDIRFFRETLGPTNVATRWEDLINYSHDETPGMFDHHTPEAVVKPSSAGEIQAIVRYCFQQSIPVTPRGAGSGLSGGCIPAYGGVVLSLERMNRVLEVDTENMVVVVEPGVITEDINRTLKPLGLFYAGYPMSVETCQIGGNVAENAGGGRAVKYGVTGTYVRGIECITGVGERVCFGGKTLKDVSSYDVVHLLVGSEGTLGIITKIVLKVIPFPRYRAVLLIPFHTDREAVIFSRCIMQEMGYIPSAVEFMNRKSLEFAYRFISQEYPYPDAGAHLLVEVDGREEEAVFQEYQGIGERAYERGGYEVFVADNATSIEEIWKVRRAIPEAVHMTLPLEVNEDVSVPVGAVYAFLQEVVQLCDAHGLISPVYGHLGDGNLHVTLAPRSPDDWEGTDTEETIRESFYRRVLMLGGALSGEHGVGLKRRKSLSLFYGREEIALLRRIKAAFDPAGILNPGKMLPDEET